MPSDKKLSKRAVARAVGSALASLAFAQSALAENQVRETDAVNASSEAGETDGGGANWKSLPTVTVTAQKREESVQDVPLPVSVIGGDKLQSNDLILSSDVARLVPNLSGQSSGGRRERPRWMIRGIGTNDPSRTVENPIGIYQDEVFVSLTAVQGFPIFDLDRVEVLRGPQGTLWGKNTTGGAINYISRKPGFERDGYLRLSAGNYGQKMVQGAFGGPISDSLAGRISISKELGDGYARNLVTGDDGPTLDDEALRAQLLAVVTPDLQALFNVHFRKLDAESSAGYPINTGQNGADSYGYIPSYGVHPKPTDAYYAPPASNIDNVFGGSLKLDWQLGDLSLTSISAYDEVDSKSDLDNGKPPSYTGVSRDVTASRVRTDNWQISQEFRLASSPQDAFSWIAGVNWFKQSLGYLTASASFAPTTPTNRTNFTLSDLHQRSESYAAFGSAKYQFTDQFNVTLGLRWTEEKKAIEIDYWQRASAASVVTWNDVSTWWKLSSISSPNSIAAFTGYGKSDNWEKLTWDITPEYRFNENLVAYLRIAEGYRSGGFNSSIVIPTATEAAAGKTPDIPQVDPETLTDYEIGLKSSWFDQRLTANAAVFYYDQKDIQLNIQSPNPGNLQNANSSTFAQNAAGGKVKGLELEVQALPLENLQISGSIGLLSTEYTDFHPTVTVGSVTQEVDRSGNEYWRSPRRSAAIDVQYRIPLGNGGSVTLGSDWNYRSHIWFSTVQQGASQGDGAGYLFGRQQQGGYTLGNARVAYRTPDERTEFFATVSNITNKTYTVITLVPSPSYTSQLGEPRRWNVGVTFKL